MKYHVFLFFFFLLTCFICTHMHFSKFIKIISARRQKKKGELLCGSLRLKEKSCSQSAVLQFTKQAKLCVFFQLQHLHVNCEGQSKCSVCCFFLCVCVLLSLHLFLSLTSPFFHLFVNAPLLGAPKHAAALLPPVHMCVFRICLQQCTVLSPSLRVSHLHTKANSFFFFLC